jgi:hypothetical protein
MRNNMESIDKAARASLFGIKPTVTKSNRPSEERIALLAYRYANKLDLWTGKPLLTLQESPQHDIINAEEG